MDEQTKPWLRQAGESSQAYGAFHSYLSQGPQRSHPKVCEEVGKSRQLISDWSAKWCWIERARAFDVYLVETSTEDLIPRLTEARDKNLVLMDKLRGLLNDRLDVFIEKKMDPTVAWTKAVEAMARVEANSIMAAANKANKAGDSVDRVAKLIERLEAAGAPVSRGDTE